MLIKDHLELVEQEWRSFPDLLKEQNMTPAVRAIFASYDVSTKLSGDYLFRTRA